MMLGTWGCCRAIGTTIISHRQPYIQEAGHSILGSELFLALIRSPGGQGEAGHYGGLLLRRGGSCRRIGPDERSIHSVIHLSSRLGDQAAGVTGAAAVEGGLGALWTPPRR